MTEYQRRSRPSNSRPQMSSRVPFCRHACHHEWNRSATMIASAIELKVTNQMSVSECRSLDVVFDLARFVKVRNISDSPMNIPMIAAGGRYLRMDISEKSPGAKGLTHLGRRGENTPLEST